MSPVLSALLVTFARHRLHVTSADPLPDAGRHRLLTSPAGRLLVSGPAGRHPLAGCTSPVARHVSGPVAPLAVTRWPSPEPFAMSPVLHVPHVSGPVAPLAVTRWPSPVAMSPVLSASSADPLHVSGPAGRLLVTFARHRLHVTSADPLPRWPSPRWPVARQRTRWPVARHRLHVTGCTSRQRTRCPAGRHRLHVTRWPVARQRTRWPSPAGRLHVSGPIAVTAGRLLVTG